MVTLTHKNNHGVVKMKRYTMRSLMEWKRSPSRKSLLLRGARQVGKTHLVRQFGTTFEHFVEINLETYPDLIPLFEGNLDPERIIRELSLRFQAPIEPGKTLLFIDEIQEFPRAIIALRYFYEKMPGLHVVAAGSLVDFAIQQVGVPVGRVEFLYLYPLSFLEFLEAMERRDLVEAILAQEMGVPFSDPIHQLLLEYFAQYLLVGGMPDAVKCWRDEKNFRACQMIHHNLMVAYRQDFHKYAKEHQVKYLNLILEEAPRFMGRKFTFMSLSGDYRKRDLDPCLDLLIYARVLHKVYQTSAQGLPLLAGSSYQRYKLIFIDIALAQTLLGIGLQESMMNLAKELVNRGEAVEALVGQELLAYSEPRMDPTLFYWHRERAGSTAEVDYVIQKGHDIFPIEVKSGSKREMRSLYRFLETHLTSSFGYRISIDPFSDEEKLASVPLYAIAKLFQDPVQ
ncbi:MAG: hypothetical protein K940chlam9_01605 [Chlamydiae bacterium]|nr:hypothetical protein [Chlamydiota bacterium]